MVHHGRHCVSKSPEEGHVLYRCMWGMTDPLFGGLRSMINRYRNMYDKKELEQRISIRALMFRSSIPGRPDQDVLGVPSPWPTVLFFFRASGLDECADRPIA